jgi:hypothetical protein
MNQMSIFVMLLASLLCPCDWSQEASEGPNMFGGLNSGELDALVASRTAARKELAENATAFDTPGIANALGSERYLIVIARISSVQLPTNADGRTIIAFHVEQLLRGESEVTDFRVESRWNPRKAKLLIVTDFNYRETALDKSEPRVGDRYILGYTLDYGVEKFVFVPGVVDLQDSAQTEMIANVRRFLNLEAEAGLHGYEIYLDALDDKAPWIRDIAVHRLTSSDACNASPLCGEKFVAAVRRELHSDLPNERGEAIAWLIWVDSVAKLEKKRKGYVDGLPILPDPELRALLDEAVHDRNVELGDQAFQAREMFDVYRNGSPGGCFEIVSALRKTAVWHTKHDPLPTEYLSYTYGCIPPR